MLRQPPAILGSLDVLSAALKLSNPSDALQLLVRCPQLLYDITIPAIQARLEQLAVVLASSSEEARDAALKEPVRHYDQDKLGESCVAAFSAGQCSCAAGAVGHTRKHSANCSAAAVAQLGQ